MAEDLIPTLLPAFMSEWMFFTTTSAPPATGQVRLNHSTQKNATLMWIHSITANGNDASVYLATVDAGEVIDITDKDDPAKWQRYSVTAQPTNKGSYVEVPVVWNAGGSNVVQQRVTLTLPLADAVTTVTGFALHTKLGGVGITGQLVTRDFAFPFDGKVYTSPGMTLRQWYAGQAIIGFCSVANTTTANLMGGKLAEYVFKLADSLIAFEAREAAGYQRPPVGSDPNAPQQVAEQQEIQKLTRLAGQRRWRG
jgi:hypothetical protein